MPTASDPETTDELPGVTRELPADDATTVGRAAAAAGVEWLALTAAGPPHRPDEPVSWRRIVVQSVLAVLVVFVVVAAAGTVAARQAAESESVNDALQVTDLLADAVVTPVLTDDLLGADPVTARQQLDQVVRDRVLQGAIIRVKVWDATGRIVYSDEPQLIGRQFPLDGEERAVLDEPSTRADVSDLESPENVFERSQGKLLEVYRPVWTPNGTPLLFETYSKYDVVTQRRGELSRGFGGITVSSLLLLLVLQAPLTWRLVQRVRRAQRQRETVLDRALAASDEERRRIAATLHDGVVQDLTASAFAVAAAADRARATPGTGDLADRLDTVAGTVRTGVGGMRSLLVDLYPASLDESGLAAALEDLAAPLRARGVEVTMDGPADLRLAPELEALLFRSAQECLRNTARHAGAERVTVRIETGTSVTLDVTDDGVGFDPNAAPAEGHFGLRLLTDLARSAGAALSLATAPGRGTHWRLEIPLT